VSELTYAGNRADARTPLISELRKLAMSEPGYYYIKFGPSSDGVVGEQLVFEDRQRRQLITDPALVLDDGGSTDVVTRLILGRSEGVVFNSVSVSVHPIDVDASAVEIFSLDTNQTPVIPPLGEFAIYCPYGDSDAAFETLGAVDVIPPVRNVDYTIESAIGAGDDYSLDIRQTILGMSSDNMVAYWMLADDTENAIREESKFNAKKSGGGGGGGSTTSTTTGITFTSNRTIDFLRPAGSKGGPQEF
jgi:hypothetical protein